jgi:hypothetical protein
MMTPLEPFKDSVYLRITVVDKAGIVRVDRIGGRAYGAEAMHASALPIDVQHKLAVLSMRDYTPPTELVAGIGRRIDRDTFWIFQPED